MGRGIRREGERCESRVTQPFEIKRKSRRKSKPALIVSGGRSGGDSAVSRAAIPSYLNGLFGPALTTSGFTLTALDFTVSLTTRPLTLELCGAV